MRCDFGLNCPFNNQRPFHNRWRLKGFQSFCTISKKGCKPVLPPLKRANKKGNWSQKSGEGGGVIEVHGLSRKKSILENTTVPFYIYTFSPAVSRHSAPFRVKSASLSLFVDLKKTSPLRLDAGQSSSTGSFSRARRCFPPCFSTVWVRQYRQTWAGAFSPPSVLHVETPVIWVMWAAALCNRTVFITTIWAAINIHRTCEVVFARRFGAGEREKKQWPL